MFKNIFFTALFALSVFVVSPAFAQTPIDQKTAENYFNSCVAKPSGSDFSEETKIDLCGCTATQMKDNMSVEDVQMLSANGQGGAAQLAALHKMITEVHAPCIHYPYREQKYKACMSSPQTKLVTNNPDAMCKCLSERVALYLEKNAQGIFRGILQRTPNISDPLVGLESDPAFRNYVAQQAQGCLGR
jgi:hypothetical protein